MSSRGIVIKEQEIKPLIVFDIDGTITATVEVDDSCFGKTLADLYGRELGEANWNEFQHATDLGVCRQVFEEEFKRQPTVEEICSIKNHFLGLLQEQSEIDSSKFLEVSGSVAFYAFLREKGYPVAIATGGWRETAIFKLEKVGLEIEEIPFANSNHHYSRSEITKLAIDKARQNNESDFKRIICFGDGKWDFLTCHELGIEFIGVDFYETGILKELGAENVITDFTDRESLLRLF